MQILNNQEKYCHHCDNWHSDTIRCESFQKILERNYTTRSSAHGSDYVPNSIPETFNMTYEEAKNDVHFWRIYADTVGGDAIIIKNPNGIS